jgi:CheY-like chemotaxis protein
MPGKTVLVIDNDSRFRQAVVSVLKPAGYNVLEAVDGPEALATIEQLRTAIDLIIVELVLPTIPGVEIIGAVTRRESPIKIVATSGAFDESYLEMVKHAGADESVHKRTMAHPEKWLEIVRRLIGDSTPAAEKPSIHLVLVVDDEAPTRAYLRSLLTRHGVQVLEAADGIDGITLLRRLGGAVDAVVTDIRMPRLNGRALGEIVRKEYPNLPLIFLSGENLYSELHQPEWGIYFVSKPFAPAELVKTILKVLTKAAQKSA